MEQLAIACEIAIATIDNSSDTDTDTMFETESLLRVSVMEIINIVKKFLSDKIDLSQFKPTESAIVATKSASDLTLDQMRMVTADIKSASDNTRRLFSICWWLLTNSESAEVLHGHTLEVIGLNQQTDLSFVEMFKSITRVWLERANFTEYPLWPRMGYLKQVTVMQLIDCGIRIESSKSEILMMIEAVSDLRTLNLSGNNIENVDWVTSASKLKFLVLADNKIKQLPKSLPADLKMFDVTGNTLSKQDCETFRSTVGNDTVPKFKFLH